eukprot:CAMPEP_0184304930 /NCGR_PEP_ID=MMETSP1049-20130417/14332_1 /TAXON_ID=77928 /ORGANISM="Proteomonas sulcata, Strain CCMP704" /LENGTH=163 /DNA_ID=CAMNT_0026616871 /DNA_START=200 /DNA_END=691 /DNA_ORIENTATION=-
MASPIGFRIGGKGLRPIPWTLSPLAPQGLGLHESLGFGVDRLQATPLATNGASSLPDCLVVNRQSLLLGSKSWQSVVSGDELLGRDRVDPRQPEVLKLTDLVAIFVLKGRDQVLVSWPPVGHPYTAVEERDPKVCQELILSFVALDLPTNLRTGTQGLRGLGV